MKNRTATGRLITRYSEKRAPIPNGLTITCRHDLVPAVIHAANDAVVEQTHVEHLALAEVGSLQRQVQTAKDADRHLYGQELADGRGDPGTPNSDGIAEQIESLTRRAAAAQVARSLLVDRLNAVMADADTTAVAVAYDSECKQKLKEARELLAAAEAARHEADALRGMSRMFDAWPLSHHNFGGRTTSNSDAWRSAAGPIAEDLQLIDEAEPLCLLDPADLAG